MFIQRYLVIILVSVSIVLYEMAIHFGFQLELAVLVSSILTLALAWYFEYRLPYRKEWTMSKGDLATDFLSAGVIIGLVEPWLKAVAPLAVVLWYTDLNGTSILSDIGLWPQIILALLLVEFGKYWSHRLHHQSMKLWWLHAMHHSSERLYFLNGLRFNPLNYIINFSISVLPVMLLGVSPEAILGYLAITQPIVLLQHANIDLRNGWLNWVFSTPEVHRWHHSTKASEANRNFGNALLIWDHVFGTFKRAEGFNDTKKVGLFTSSKVNYPGQRGYFTQLFSMFKLSCCRT